MQASNDYQHQELEKFSQLAKHWWDPEKECKPLHDINPLRLDFIKSHCQLKGKSILDVGCGGGILTESLAKEGAEASGIDLSNELISIAKQHALEMQLNIDYQCISADDLAVKQQESFDVITCMELLEHAENPSAIITALTKLLKPQGKIFFSTINRNIKAYVQAILFAEYLLKLLPAGTHDYAHFIKPSELDKVARKHHLVVEAISGLSYDVLKQTYYLTDNIDVNYMMCYQKI